MFFLFLKFMLILKKNIDIKIEGTGKNCTKTKLHEGTKLHEDNFAPRVNFVRRVIFAREYKKTEKKTKR